MSFDALRLSIPWRFAQGLVCLFTQLDGTRRAVMHQLNDA